MITCPPPRVGWSEMALLCWRYGESDRVRARRCGDGGGGSEADRTRRCFWIPLCLCSFSSELDDIRIDDIATNR